MAVTRRAVLEELATASDATQRETTTNAALAAALDIHEATIASYLDGLTACELATTDSDGIVRVTITGEELLTFNTDGLVIVDLT